MSDEDRTRQLVQSLDEALASLAEDPRVAASVRRVGRFVSGLPEAPTRARELGRELADAGDEAVAELGAQLRIALAAEVDDWGGKSSPRRILLVEAEPSTAAALRNELEVTGFEVVWVAGGGPVLGLLSEGSVDLVVVDVLLPDRDGRDLILEISQNPATARLPIIALSPSTGRLSLARSECIALGADVFMERSEAPGLIGREIARLLGPGETPSHESDRAGVLRRARFNDRFRERPIDAAAGGVVALLAFESFRGIADREGLDAADAALSTVARALEQTPGVSAVGRWATSQLVVMMAEVFETAASQTLRTAIEDWRTREWPDSPSALMAKAVTGAVVPAPRGSELDDRCQIAGRVRLGLANEGTRLVPADTGDDRPRSILVVEDDPVASALVGHKLKHIGFQVHSYADGDEASEAIPGLDFDLAILDVNLPGRDGFALVREIREGGVGAQRPIIILSGMGSDDDIVRGLEAGADDYMLKPFSPIELTARVRRLLEATRPA